METVPLINLARARQSPILADMGDTELTELILAATSAIEGYCGREFALASRAETYDGDGTDTLLLRAYPITSIASIAVQVPNGFALPDSANTILTTDVTFEARRGIVRMNRSTAGYWRAFPKLSGALTVTYVGGFDTIPAALRAACVQQAIIMHTAERTDPIMTSEKLGNYANTIRTPDSEGDGIAANVKRLIHRYKEYRL